MLWRDSVACRCEASVSNIPAVPDVRQVVPPTLLKTSEPDAEVDRNPIDVGSIYRRRVRELVVDEDDIPHLTHELHGPPYLRGRHGNADSSSGLLINPDSLTSIFTGQVG